MNASQPFLGRLARLFGMYRLLHGYWIAYLVRLSGIGLKRGIAGVFELSKGDRVIRYSNWSMAFFVARHFDYYFNAVYATPCRGRRLVDYSHPAWHRLQENGELFYFNDLAEPEATSAAYLLHAKLRPGDVVFDLGAYNGTQTVFFSRAVGSSGAVYAFEPDSHSRESLEQNLSIYNARNVHVSSTGVWSHSGELLLASDGTMESSLVVKHEHDGESVLAEVTSLDDFIMRTKLERVDFVKMDIEGAEVEALKGFTSGLRRFRPRLAIETHVVDGRDLYASVEEILTSLGYVCRKVPQPDCELPLLLADRASPPTALTP